MNLKKFSGLILTLLSVAAVIVIFAVILFQSQEEYSESYFYSMDTYVEIVGDNEIKDEVKQIFSDTEKIFDNYNPSSEVSQLNKSGKLQVSQKLLDAVTQITGINKLYGNSADITIGSATKLWNITGENPSVPSDAEIENVKKSIGYENIKIKDNTISLENNAILDFGCAAKGIALDYIKEEFDKQKTGKAVVSAGSSSILLYGDDTFTTSILSPDSEEILGKLHTKSGFVSTSGGYHRYTVIDEKNYIHILDTKTARPSETDLTSVTVFCQNGLESDFLSTMIFAEGTVKLSDYLKNENFQIVAVDRDKNVYVSENLDFELTNNSYKLC